MKRPHYPQPQVSTATLTYSLPQIDVNQAGFITIDQWTAYLREHYEKNHKKGERWLTRLNHTLSVNMHQIAVDRAKVDPLPHVKARC